jgi:polyketide synthase PksJ
MKITGDLFAAIKALAIRENCGLSMVILTAISILLYSYTKQQEIRVGMLVANRRSSDTEAVFGHFVNTVVIRALVSPGMTCAQLLKEVRAVTIEAYANQDLPFEKVAQVLADEQNRDRSSLFHFLLNYQKVQLDHPQAAGITIAPFQVARVIGAPQISITPLEMIFDVREASTELTVSVNRRSGILNKTQSSRMKAHFANILKSLLTEIRTVASVGAKISATAK